MEDFDLDETLDLIREDLKDLEARLKKAEETGQRQLGLTAADLKMRIKEIKQLLN